MNVLITGANGQLGHDFQKLFTDLNINYTATDYQELDITDEDSLKNFFKGNKKFDIIINCAAYNNVDKAESEKDFCYKLNTWAPQKLAEISKNNGAIFVTYSTDFVFDGEIKRPLSEEDTPNPLSVYGKTKYEGEIAVLDTYKNSFVIRTSWVYGIANNNFNKQIINWSKVNEKLSIVDDQISVPTYSKDLAYYSWKLIETQKYGLYHLVNNGVASKYDQAKYILDKIEWCGVLETAKTKDFNLPGKRAEYSKLSVDKIEKIIKEPIPFWQDSIDRFLKEMEENNEL